MLYNFHIEEIANHYNVDVIILMKDELKNMKPINMNYIINLESSKDGNGTHWMALKILLRMSTNLCEITAMSLY